jgi:LysM repeat protein
LRAWTKSACAAVAWGLLLTVMVAAASLSGSVRPAQAATRIARSTTQLTAARPVSPAAAAVQAAIPAGAAARYAVRPGDTLSGIAAACGVPGGWPSLYAANRAVIGPDPGLIRPGTVLVLPGREASQHYTITVGQTLSGIAAELGVPGGWPALYAANRHAIGPDPDLIRPGTILTIPPPPATATAPRQQPARPARPVHRAHPGHPAQLAPRPAPPGNRQHPTAFPAGSPAAAGMPGWLRTILLAAGLLIAAAFATELVLAIARRHRQANPARDAPSGTRDAPSATSDTEPGAASRDAVPPVPEPRHPGKSRPMNPAQTRILMADYDRLIVTHNKADDLICVLRPPGEDPKAILRVARLVLKEDPYQQLATQLGLSASWPMD